MRRTPAGLSIWNGGLLVGLFVAVLRDEVIWVPIGWAAGLAIVLAWAAVRAFVETWRSQS